MRAQRAALALYYGYSLATPWMKRRPCSPELSITLKSRVNDSSPYRPMSSPYANRRKGQQIQRGIVELYGQVRDEWACRTVCLSLCQGVSNAGAPASPARVA